MLKGVCGSDFRDYHKVYVGGLSRDYTSKFTDWGISYGLHDGFHHFFLYTAFTKHAVKNKHSIRQFTRCVIRGASKTLILNPKPLTLNS